VTAKELGMAQDFYRLRLMQLDAGDLPDLEWRDDVLYREQPISPPNEYEAYVVQAVELDADDSSTALASFADHAEAHAWLVEAEEDLRELTRSEFELRYFPREPAPGGAPEDPSTRSKGESAG
jgi:hypothetical protein